MQRFREDKEEEVEEEEEEEEEEEKNRWRFANYSCLVAYSRAHKSQKMAGRAYCNKFIMMWNFWTTIHISAYFYE